MIGLVRSRSLLAAVGVVAVVSALAFVLWPRPTQPTRRASEGFEERGLESGITFRMAFLPGEQGEKFKVNLYDHGCGVAVGDYDGDGHDDIYLVNQLGENALYHNNGDGTFTDVTKHAGV